MLLKQIGGAMGATVWSYFTPYNENVEVAFQALRRRIFEKKEYGFLHQLTPELLEDVPPMIRSVLKQELGATAPGDFDSIDDLLRSTGDKGTHTCLDLWGTAPAAEFGAMWPAPLDTVARVYGTDRPTHGMIEQRPSELSDAMELERWQGLYVVVYAGSKPSELYLEGATGD